MKQLLNNPWVVGALCIAAAITVYLRLFDSKSSPVEPPPPVEQPVVVAVPPPAQPPSGMTSATAPRVDSSQSRVPIVGTWIDKITRDPFRRGREDKSPSISEIVPGDDLADPNQPLLRSEQALRLQAIFVNGSNRIAVINSIFVKVGDEIGGYRVSQIKADGVWLKSTTEKHWVEFGSGQSQQEVS